MKQAKEKNKEIILRLVPVSIFCIVHRLTLIISLESIAKARGISMAQVAIAWQLSKKDITAPIIGVTSLERLRDTIGRWHFTYS
jgi:aryl-alcohol dehydrogenase-like predicted oxidoreductase